jgi:hypothetical protein
MEVATLNIPAPMRTVSATRVRPSPETGSDCAGLEIHRIHEPINYGFMPGYTGEEIKKTQDGRHSPTAR